MVVKQLCFMFRNISLEHNILCKRNFFTSTFNCRETTDRKEMLRSAPATDEGAVGEKSIDVDSIIHKNSDTFPTFDTPNRIFNGIAFKNLPIFNIRVSPNNTIVCLTDAKGNFVSHYANSFLDRIKPAIISSLNFILQKALEKGIKTVRVRVRGLGPGRMAAIKGLQLSGLEIVSITDSTHVSWNPPRARKQRKL
nr:uncharacterized protein LOC111502462 [Leptinotarsa decemlineata]